MKFAFSKNKMQIGGGALLLLLIFLSQSSLLNFYFNSYLGRLLVIATILYFSYLHHILGIIVVLLFVIAFNSTIDTNPMYVEGMETASPAPATAPPSIEKEKVKETGKEGFDIIGTESAIKRGKPSNSISVLPSSKKSDTIAPYSTFTEFASFQK
jgi:hypothetical protein